MLSLLFCTRFWGKRHKNSTYTLMLLLFFNIVFGLVLIGCSDNVDNGTRVADYYSGLSTMNVLADINANFGDYFVDFQLEFKYNAQGESIIEVKKPSEIEGVKVRFVDDEIILDYEGVSLEMGPSENSAISPVGALSELLRVWRDGMVSDQGHEKVDGTDCIYISHKATRDSVEIQYCTWFDAESLKPIKAEINEDGHRKILCTYLIAEKFE